jgi:hypothetical protein
MVSCAREIKIGPGSIRIVHSAKTGEQVFVRLMVQAFIFATIGSKVILRKEFC